MKTPIYDFVKKYAASDTVRLHMPGHKGKGRLGIENLDLTEIGGADFLYGAKGIIAESEANATALFKTAHSFYSTEGSTLAIKAMLALALAENLEDRSRPMILAARNAHKAFISSAALLDLSVEWLYPSECEHLCKCTVTPNDLRDKLSDMEKLPKAVYITSPDYLGNIADIKGLSVVCDSFGIPLLVDNAHGAYLAFLTPSEHPIALGAAMCADSAHKTLPVLTGGAYLHIAKKAEKYLSRARSMLSLFASTSPSYLTLQSLDLCNEYLSCGYEERLNKTLAKVSELKERLISLGFEFEGDEKLKIVIRADKYGYTGEELADFLRKSSIEIEFADCEMAVMMLTPENADSDYSRLYSALSTLPRRDSFYDGSSDALLSHNRACSIREAAFADSETVSVEVSAGRVCAVSTVSCPPAVPIVISGEIITREDVELFKKYGITDIEVIK